MSTTDPQSTGSSPAGPTCGNCGAAVESTSVTCPACGVLLAAYQAAFGSGSQPGSFTGGDSSATQSVPSMDAGVSYGSSATGPSTVTPGSGYQSPPPPPTSTPPTYPSPTHQPRSQSPIGDALRSSHAGMTSALHPDSLVASDAPADELARMASADDDLADMADGDDELADMASGQDELARMASGGKSTLAEQVEAELAGATVRFDGSSPVIEAPEVTVTNPGEGEPDVVEHFPPADAGDSPRPDSSQPIEQANRSASSPPEAGERQGTDVSREGVESHQPVTQSVSAVPDALASLFPQRGQPTHPESNARGQRSSLFPPPNPAEVSASATRSTGQDASQPGPASPANSPSSEKPPASSPSSRNQSSASTSGATREKYRAPAIDWVNNSGRPQTRAHTSGTIGSPVSYPDPAAKQVAVTRFALMGCLPFVLLFSVILWIFQGGNAGSTFFGILFIAGIFYLLLKFAGATSRKTTSMPTDATWNAKRKR